MAIQPVTNSGPPGGMAAFSPPQTRSMAQATNLVSAAESTSAADSETKAIVLAGDDAKLAAQPPSKTEVEDAVAKVQKAVEAQASNLLFSIDEDSGRTIVKVVDSSTKETIRQIPSEEILSIAKALDKLQGLLIRDTA